MTGRERLLNVLHGRAVDRPAWTTLVDDVTRSIMPETIREMPVLDWYRSIRCDILLFGNYGLPAELRVSHPCRMVTPGTSTQSWPEGEESVHQWRSPWGTLTRRSRSSHPTKYAVETIEDLRVLKAIWENSRYEEVPGTEEGLKGLDRRLGHNGLFVPTVGPSPVQQLIEYDMGLEAFYVLLQDHKHDVEELLDIMHSRRKQEYEICARRYPCPAMIQVENTSSSLVSPGIYRRYSLPQVRDFVEIAHRWGKKAIIHMCGLLKGLLQAFTETGMDGINGLTPPPIGDCPFEDALDAMGEDLVILGGVLDGAVFHGPNATRERIWNLLDRVYTPRVRQANLLLWVPADGLPTPMERFHAVRDWMDRQ